MIFPENMNPINPEDVTGSLNIMSEYIRYMVERMDFWSNTLEKRLTAMEARIKTLEGANPNG